MSIIEIRKMLLTRASTFRLREKQAERGRFKTLSTINLREKMINVIKVSLFIILTISVNSCSFLKSINEKRKLNYPIEENSQFENIGFKELQNIDLFTGHDGPGLTIFAPLKLRTEFNWPGNISQTTDEITKDVTSIFKNNNIDVNYVDIYSHYVDINTKEKVNWSKDKVNRTTRIYLQESLMIFIKEELIDGDRFVMEYNLIGPFNELDQIIHCFIVSYYKLENE